MRRPRAAASVLLVAASLALSSSARADDPEPDASPKADFRARAQQLFDSALADAEAGNFAAACPKFLASQEADPKTSTLLNLANCYEKNGQTASAWGAFREAENLARKASRADWEASAKQRAEALETQLVRLSIVVPEESRLAGMSVLRDGVRLPQGEWGVAIPVDPGEHVVTATHEGYRPWEKRVEVKTSSAEISVPPLQALPAPRREAAGVLAPDEGPAKDKKKGDWSTWKLTGAFVAGAGVAGILGGGLLGAVAKGEYSDARARCTLGTRGCPADAVADADSAYGTATGATILFITGAVLLAGGIALFVVDPQPKSARTTGLALRPSGLSARW